MFSTYIPHYTKLIERKPHINKELHKLGINNAKFITRYDGDSLTGEDMKQYIDTPEYFHAAVKPSIRKLGLDGIEQRRLKNPGISLVLKHFEALRLFLQSTSDYALVLEDDVSFIYETDISVVIKNAPKDFDVLFLGGPLQREFFNVIESVGDYFLVGHPATNTTCSIIYGRDSATKLLRAYNFYGFCLPIDWQLNYFLEVLDLKVYHLFPKLCTQLSGTEFRSSQ